ncbi:hypothetical protein [Myroides phaeus]|uniref:hypothetical protein n=1 Tax=Myroides phaeus TaxID=702745 RepID=UPI001303A720|nr:hypothetical protein [Myroides phaeus]
MKKLILSASVAFSVLATTNVSAQQGFGTNAPHKSSAVDIVSSKRGLLIPRIDIADLDKAAPVSDPADALMVYNKGTQTAPGFYYWEKNRWVRFVASNTEKTVTVTAGTNVNVDVDSSKPNTTDYKVSVKGGDKDGKVLVTKIDGSNSTTVWIDPKEFVFNAVSATNGLTVINDKEGNSQFELGGALTKDLTTIGTGNGKNLAIIGLTDVSDKFDGKEQKIVVMGADGILKITSPKSLIEESIAKGNLVAKTLTTDGKIVIGDDKKSELPNSVLVETKLSIKEGSITTTEIANDAITSEKIKDGEVKTSDLAGGAVTAEKLGAKTEDQGKVPVVQVDGTVVYKNIFEEGVNAKTLKGSGITVTAGDTEGTGLSVASSLLKDVTLGIANDAITSEKIKDGEVKTSDLGGGAVTTEKISDGAVTADKMTAGTVNGEGKVDYAAEGTVPVAGKDGKVTYQNVSATLGKALTTDGKIVIGDDKKSELPKSVLVDTKLSIKEGSITTTEIADNTIQNEDIQSKTIGVDKLDATGATAGHVATVNTDGTVSYSTITPAALTDKKTLTTDGVIVIGENGEAKETTATNSLLADVKLNIGKDKITADHIATGAVTSDEIADGTIQAVDMKSDGNSKVLVTNEKGEVIWTEQSALNNKDKFEGEGPIAVNAGTDNKTGGKDYTISIANANGNSTAGVVKEAKEKPTINFVDGVATVNVAYISETQGKGLTSTSITVKDGANALLHAASIEITPGETDGMVLVTTGTDTKTTKWVPAGELGNTVTANNGLAKDDKHNITLGGDIDLETTLNVTDGKGSLSIKGLKSPKDLKNSNVVVGSDGKLAVIDKTPAGPVTINNGGEITINGSTVANYHPSMEEIVIEVTLGEKDTNLQLPVIDGTSGQTISVKIINENESHTGYLNIKSGTDLLAYGAMPFQGWIIKSNGTKWIIVGRN